MIVLDRYPVSEIRVCLACSTFDGLSVKHPGRRMHYRRDGAWRCEVCEPFRVEPTTRQESVSALAVDRADDSPRAQGGTDTTSAGIGAASTPPATEQLDLAPCAGGGSPFERAVATWGACAQTEMAIEEMAECIVALRHFARGRVGLEAVAEEVADVMIMAEQLRLIVGLDRVDAAYHRKLARLMRRLDAEPAPATSQDDRWAARLRTLGDRAARAVAILEGREPLPALSQSDRQPPERDASGAPGGSAS